MDNGEDFSGQPIILQTENTYATHTHIEFYDGDEASRKIGRLSLPL